MNTTSKEQVKKGSWSSEEDQILINYIRIHGDGKWPTLPKKAGLNRGGKSCRLRWRNYLRPGIVRGNISKDEEDLIIKLQSLVGNRWSLIAEMLPGRTDNEIKNYWNTSLAKKLGHTKRPSASTKSTVSQTPKKKQLICDQTSENNSHSNVNQSEESYSYQTVHDNGQSSNDYMNTNLTVGSSALEQQEDDDLLSFLMNQYDLGNLNNVFDQELMTTDHNAMMNPRNDQFQIMVEEDEALKLQNVAEPLLMNTDGNGDQIQVEDDVNMMIMKNCEVASMEDTHTLNNLKELASFLDVEYEWKNDIWYQMVTKINQL